MPDQDDTRDLVAAYVLDAVDDVERRAVERLIARDPEVAREVAELRAVAAALGEAVPGEPPAGLRAAVLTAAAGTSQLTRATAVPTDAPAGTAVTVPARPRRRPGTWLAVAAALVVGAAVPATVAWQQADRAQVAEEQQRALAELLADPTAVVVHGAVEGGGTATAVLTADRALFSAVGLADPGAGRTYQLWVIRDDVPIPGAVLADDAGRVRGLTEDFGPGDALAVTVEPAGGSELPTTDPVVVLGA